jgi:hypothetical protein
MMETMEMVSFDKYLSYRSTEAVQRAVRRMTARVDSRDDLAWQGRPPTKESIINACLLYVSELPEDELAAILAEYLPKLETAMSAAEARPAEREPIRGSVTELPPEPPRRRPGKKRP